MGRLLLVRHCETSGQHADASLTEAGSAAAMVLAERLAALSPTRSILAHTGAP